MLKSNKETNNTNQIIIYNTFRIQKKKKNVIYIVNIINCVNYIYMTSLIALTTL
jgi:hypothetical protein